MQDNDLPQLLLAVLLGLAVYKTIDLPNNYETGRIKCEETCTRIYR